MRHFGSFLAITVGVGTLIGTATSGCGGETASITTGGNGASGGGGSGGNPNASSSSGGNTGGSGGCSSAADCSDGFSCTIDSCEAGTCQHVVGPNSGSTACPMGQICNLQQGCIELVICANDATCITKLGSDPCKTNIYCDLAMSVCSYTTLDKDNDGQAPVVCNGKDCDDANPDTYQGAPEKCDGKDNNCNGSADESAMCPGMSTCEGGSCTCPPENTCGPDCVDLMTDETHCGMCNNACTGVATCINGQCNCPGGATTCPNGVCVDTRTDPLNCGGCGKTCAAGYSCVNSLCTCLGTPCGTACIDTMNDAQHCGGCNMPCPVNAQCMNGICGCPAGQTYCSNQCVDTKTNTNHCGGCNMPCAGICSNGMCSGCTVANLYLFADISGSMADAAGSGGSKLEAMRSGINAFLSNSASANMGVGIGYHPVPGTGTTMVCAGTNLPCTKNEDCPIFMICGPGTAADSCTDTDYQTPAVGIALLPGNQNAVTMSMAGKTSGGGSMPPPGYRGALQYAKNYAISHSTQKVAVVLLADDMPNICNTTSDVPDDLIPIAQQFANGSPRVITYVIGLTDGVSPNPTQAQLNQIAAAGGTTTAFLANSTASVTAALNSIRTQFKTCP